jgi:hypothetical protein
MTRQKFRWDGEKLVPYEKERPPEVDAPNVKVDEMAPMQSMADCKYYTSKSAYRRSLKEQGFIEVGNDVDGFKKKDPFATKEYQRQLKEDMTRAWYECRDKMAPASELDRERYKRIDRQNERAKHDRRERDRTGRPRD